MLTGKGLVEYAKGKVGTPYFFGSKMEVLTNAFMATMHRMYPGTVTEKYIQKAKSMGNVGKINVDCSGLIGAYRKKQVGSSQLYQTAYARLSTNEYFKWADGVVCWRQGHVGVFSREGGKCYVYEAKGIDYGTVKSEFIPSKWTCGLTFSDIDYCYDEKVADTTWKGINPYKEPTTNLKIGSTGNSVKWVQWELVEAGFDIVIDGDYGQLTDLAVRQFQKSSRIECDGIVGKITRQYLKADSNTPTPEETYQIGVDVSKYQKNIDWKKVKDAGMKFAVLKVTRKDNNIEESFERNYSGCRENQIPIAVYRYVYATSMLKAEEEAKGIIDALKGKPIEGEVWLDIEEPSLARIGKSALTLIIDQEAKILKAAGYKVGIYCCVDWFKSTIDVELSKRYPFWLAAYGKNDGKWEGRSDNPKGLGCVAWQFTSKGRVNGIEGDVDISILF